MARQVSVGAALAAGSSRQLTGSHPPRRTTLGDMIADERSVPDPCDADFYVRYVEICRQAGVDPVSPQRARELVGRWNRMLTGPLVSSARSPAVDAL
jgi:hypothetical protein